MICPPHFLTSNLNKALVPLASKGCAESYSLSVICVLLPAARKVSKGVTQRSKSLQPVLCAGEGTGVVQRILEVSWRKLSTPHWQINSLNQDSNKRLLYLASTPSVLLFLVSRKGYHWQMPGRCFTDISNQRSLCKLLMKKGRNCCLNATSAKLRSRKQALLLSSAAALTRKRVIRCPMMRIRSNKKPKRMTKKLSRKTWLHLAQDWCILLA